MLVQVSIRCPSILSDSIAHVRHAKMPPEIVAAMAGTLMRLELLLSEAACRNVGSTSTSVADDTGIKMSMGVASMSVQLLMGCLPGRMIPVSVVEVIVKTKKRNI